MQGPKGAALSGSGRGRPVAVGYETAAGSIHDVPQVVLIALAGASCGTRSTVAPAIRSLVLERAERDSRTAVDRLPRGRIASVQ